MSAPQLTSMRKSGGCGCKISKADLDVILKSLPKPIDENILIGAGSADDAAVYRIDDKRALIQTVDFFTAPVDDPYQFGAIAAANAISDIYAMGASPLFALNIIAYPAKERPLNALEAILKGGADKALEAGINIIGGHSIDDAEPKYGLCVTAIADIDRIISNGGAKVGDALILTKALGTGIILNASSKGKATQEQLHETIKSMSALNKDAAQAMTSLGINAATDITGFGLLGHLNGILNESKVGATLNAGSAPVLPGALHFAKKGYIPGGSRKNLAHINDTIVWSKDIPPEIKYILTDAQTSGGLLICCPPDKKDSLIKKLNESEAKANVIGTITQDSKCRIIVNP